MPQAVSLSRVFVEPFCSPSAPVPVSPVPLLELPEPEPPPFPAEPEPPPFPPESEPLFKYDIYVSNSLVAS